ncbi:outer membrane beta-barrel family protein [Ferruginibacter albus]|uniref:outer membrane beta-barrel family protein n=1 Tax=Ferruginibacter albus TaxID=2875540 RepID=UPI001CC49BCA|nr:outer membrane beta-barrel family protein [Ferruginibacter albus]UAY51164.1 TonB-dependent receptor [Ferruginibacter albus]
MKYLLQLLTVMSFGLTSLAQTSGKISGIIRDGGDQKVINAASVSLLKSKDSSLIKKDSSLIKIVVADSAGNFVFENVQEGSYFVKATSIGHNIAYSNIITISNENPISDVGVLQLLPLNKDLKEVVVNSKKPLIERKADRTIINVDASVTNTGSTVLEVLEKSPGVTVDKDGNISLKGKQGVIVMIDGKPSYMSGQDLANFLKSMPSSNLDQIELMTNPSAKYDAAGNSGIINLKTKKTKAAGFNGSLNLAYGQGIYSRTNNSLLLNYRKNKFNLFTTISANARTTSQDLYITRHFKNPDGSTSAIFEQTSYIKHKNQNYNAKVGLDYYASKNTTFGIVLTGYTTPEQTPTINTNYLKGSTGITDSIVVAESNEDMKWKNGAVNLNFRHQFDSTGTELTADIDYLNYHSNRSQYFNNYTYLPDWTPKDTDMITGELPSNINIYSAKADYTHPFKSGLKLEAGVKSSYVETDNNASYFNIINDQKEIDYDKTNRFTYKENINAAYINFSKEIKKWSFQAGLRMENTNYNGHQFGNAQHPELDSSFQKSYVDVFPTLYAGYNASEKNQFTFSIGRRINRPNYEDLNPFLFFLDKYTYAIGNPFLRPSYANVVEVSHTYKQFLTTTLNYSHTSDIFTQVFRPGTLNEFSSVISQGNYASSDQASLSVTAQIPVTKWWTSILYTEGDFVNFKGTVDGDYLNVSAGTFLINVNNQFTFGKGWSAELSGFYRTRGIDAQVIVDPLGQIDMGVQKKLLKDKASIKLNLKDPFKLYVEHGGINFHNTDATFRQYGDFQSVTLGFVYRFGKPIKGVQKRKTGGADEEQNRVKKVD